MAPEDKNNEPKARKLRVLLLKKGIRAPEEAIRDEVLKSKKYKWHALKSDLGFGGGFFLPSKPYKEPPWLGFINEGLEVPIKPVKTRTAAGILFVEVTFKRVKRILAYTFGFARSFLKPGCYEFDFGISTVLSAVDPASIQGLEYKTIAETVINTLQQSSRLASLGSFDLDFTRDMLRAASGKPTEGNLGRRIDGSDSLAFGRKLLFKDLGKASKEILEVYYSNAWEDKFPRYDSFKNIKDPGKVEQLDQELIGALREVKEGEPTKVQLAPPGILDYNLVRGFSYSVSREDEYPELDISDYLKNVTKADITIENVKGRHRVAVLQLSSGNPIYWWPIYNCLDFETELDDGVYVLSDGKWFRVNRNLVGTVDGFIATLDPVTINLPDAQTGEVEGDYNSRVALNDPTIVLLDKKTIRTAQTKSAVEPCDLFTINREFVHVKRGGASSKLSHLFAQGSVAAALFVYDKEFRQKLRERIGPSNDDHARLIPDDNPPAAAFKVVYAIISKPREKGILSLPFFSRLHLWFHGRIIIPYGYTVSATMINTS